MLLVSGEAGVGKSRLAGELRRDAASAGWYSFVGRCVEMVVGDLPYGPVAEGLRSLREEAMLPPALGEILGTNADIQELFATDPTSLGKDLARRRTFESVLGLVARASGEQPLLIVLEDLHWADSSTLALLRFVAHNLRRHRVLVVATCRSEGDLTSRPPVGQALEDLLRLRSTEQLDLAPFNREELAQLAARLLGQPLEPELLDRLEQRSDGNAFLAEELLSSQALREDADLPSRLATIVRVRLATLSADARAIVQVAATIGREIPDELLSEVCGLDEETLTRGLRTAVSAGTLVPGSGRGSYAFRHWLVKEVVYRDLLPIEQRRLHRVVARALSRGLETAAFPPVAAAEVAAHWSAAHDLPQALAAAVHAGGLAVGVNAFAEADGQLERALALWGRVAEHDRLAGLELADLLQQAAEAARWAGRHGRAVDLANRARRELSEAEPARVAVLLEKLGRYQWEAGDSQASLDAYEEARRLLPAGERRLADARILAGQAHMLMLRGRFQESRTVAEEAIELAQELGAKAEESHALCTLGTDLGMLGDPVAAERALRKAWALAKEIGSIEDVSRAITNLADTLDFSGKLEEAAEVALEGFEMTVRYGVEFNAGGVMLGNAVSALRRLGRWDEAERHAARLTDRAPDGIIAPIQIALANICLARGDLAVARDHAATAERLCLRNTDPQYCGPLHTLRAELALAHGDLDAALQAVDDGLAALAGSEEEYLVVKLCAVALRGIADRRARRSAPGTELKPGELLDLAEHGVAALAARGTPFPEAEADLASAQAEAARYRGELVPEAWREVARRFDALNQPFPAAYAQFRLAEALADLHKRPQAAKAAGTARDLATRLGAAGLVRDIDALVTQARLHLPDQPTKPASAADPLAAYKLTPRERQIVELLVEGMTNQQIASRLPHPEDRVVSEKTVSVHVSHILAKLGVENRTQAMRLLHQLGIDPSTSR